MKIQEILSEQTASQKQYAKIKQARIERREQEYQAFAGTIEQLGLEDHWHIYEQFLTDNEKQCLQLFLQGNDLEAISQQLQMNDPRLVQRMISHGLSTLEAIYDYMQVPNRMKLRYWTPIMFKNLKRFLKARQRSKAKDVLPWDIGSSPADAPEPLSYGEKHKYDKQMQKGWDEQRARDKQAADDFKKQSLIQKYQDINTELGKYK